MTSVRCDERRREKTQAHTHHLVSVSPSISYHRYSVVNVFCVGGCDPNQKCCRFEWQALQGISYGQEPIILSVQRNFRNCCLSNIWKLPEIRKSGKNVRFHLKSMNNFFSLIFTTSVCDSESQNWIEVKNKHTFGWYEWKADQCQSWLIEKKKFSHEPNIVCISIANVYGHKCSETSQKPNSPEYLFGKKTNQNS